MSNVSVVNLLKKVYGANGIAFPTIPTTTQPITSAGGFNAKIQPYNDDTKLGRSIRKYTDTSLGKYEFMPVTIDGIDIPNALIIITGEKEIIVTNVIGAMGKDKDGKLITTGGTVFEKSYLKPYDITVIATLIGEDGFKYPEEEMWTLTNLWKKDKVVTIKCALTDFFLTPNENALITKISVLDNAGAENVEILQFDMRSNIDFKLEF